MVAAGRDYQMVPKSQEGRLWKQAHDALETEIIRLIRERDEAVAQRDRIAAAGWTVVNHGTIDPYDVHKALERALLADTSTPDRLAAEREAGRRWRHVKRGTEHVEVGRAELQLSDADGYTLSEGDTIVIYRGTDGALWAREEEEFGDGRFVEITALRDTPATPETGKSEEGGDE